MARFLFADRDYEQSEGITATSASISVTMDRMTRTYPIANLFENKEMLQDVALRDTFDIAGIGKLKIDSISMYPYNSKELKQSFHMVFNCSKTFFWCNFCGDEGCDECSDDLY